jgi:hypothetical protein
MEAELRWWGIYPAENVFKTREEFVGAPTYFVQAYTIDGAIDKVGMLDDRVIDFDNDDGWSSLEVVRDKYSGVECPICVIYHMAGGAVVPMWQNT